MLIQKGADVNAIDKDTRETPLHKAVYKGEIWCFCTDFACNSSQCHVMMISWVKIAKILNL